LEAGARIAVNPEKRHPADFALWKRAEPGHIMQWPSPWGWGYPGWHIECSVMSQKYLGETFDIHGGGIENKFPHHECEIAQAECATGKPFARYWLHNNMCTVNGQKMGKSLGNAISLKQIFREGHELLEHTYAPVVVRHFILTSHYRATLDFSNPALQAAEKGCYKLRDTLRELSQQAPRAPEKPRSDQIRAALEAFEQRFTDAMNEDFNSAAAIAAVFDIARQVEHWLTSEVGREDLLAADALLNRCVGDVLGLVWPAESAAERARVEALVQLLIELRNDARKQKNFALADTIRDRLAQLGIELRDTPQGTKYKL
ncbi:MAG: cysteine--tRNA ligase, partial [Planctomycetota bacterium]